MKYLLTIPYLSVEVTRRCNMACAHCLRGSAQNKDLDLIKFRHFLKKVHHIGSLTLTGGEPTLNVQGMKLILEALKKENVTVDNFYIVTNGLKIEAEFLHTVLDYYAYCLGDPAMNGIALSRDKYHEAIPYGNKHLLEAFSFFYPDDHNFTKRDMLPIDIGRARNLATEKRAWMPGKAKAGIGIMPRIYADHQVIYVDSDINLSFTVDGEILSDCDYAYNCTDLIKVCDYNNAIRTFLRIARKGE